MRPSLLMVLLVAALNYGSAQISVDPNSTMANSSFTVTITGTNTNFMQGTTTCIEFTNGNTTYSLTDVDVDSETSLTGTFTAPANAPVGNYDVKVYLGPDCDSTEWDCQDCFSVIECNIAAAGQGTDVTCNGADDGTAMANVTGGADPVTISWSNGMTGATITGLPPGTYDFTAEDGLGCSVDGSVTIVEPDVLNASVAGTMDVSCFGDQDGSIDLMVTGGTGNKTYMWDNGAGNVEDPTDLAAGSYNVVVMDANGCIANATAEVATPDSIGLEISSSDLTAVMSNDGTAAVIASGGDGNYSYVWNTGATTASIDGLEAGTYSVTVTDGNGCENTGTTEVSGVECTISLSSEVSNILCEGDSTGVITYVIEGASEQVLLTVNGQPTLAEVVVHNLPAGIYEAIVFDSSNSCTSSIIDTVVQPDAISIVIDSTRGDTGEGNGRVDVTVTGGSGTLTFEWTSQGAVVGVEEDLIDAASGLYFLQVTDANGCEAFSDSVVIEMTTSILEETFGASIQIYPNPTEGQLQIVKLDQELSIGEKVDIYGNNGSLYLDQKLNGNRLDLSALPSGIYWAKIKVDGQPYLTKIVRL